MMYVCVMVQSSQFRHQHFFLNKGTMFPLGSHDLCFVMVAIILLTLSKSDQMDNDHHHLHHTVDGRNPAPVERTFLPLFTGFYTSQSGAGFLPSTASSLQ